MAPPSSAWIGRASDAARKRKAPPPTDAASSKTHQGKDNSSNTNNLRGYKRTKVQDARSLRAQPADAALKDGSLDLQAFLAAREYEIRALTAGMSASKNVNNRRAFQLVPRAMRRRTASHNIKKLPKRLRSRARREQVDDNTPNVEVRRRKPKTTRGRIRAEAARRLGILTDKKKRRRLREAKERAKGGDDGMQVDVEESAAIKQLIKTRPARPKIRRNLLNEPPKPKARFRKRQINKTWMPTHLWHAKRAKMTPPKDPLWRFAVPLTPNEKVYRPTHRASTVKGAMIWDMSYMSSIGLYGHEAGLQRVLTALGLFHGSLWDTRGLGWRQGRRKWSGMLSRETGGTRRPIGPATVIWNPESEPLISQAPGEQSQPAQKHQRQVYLRLHPSCFLDVFNSLTTLINRETPRVYVEDLRFEIGSIELTGPGATEALLGSIRPYYQEGKEAHASLFESFRTTFSDTALPPDGVLGFSIQDPRLHYPPRTIQPPAAESTLPDPLNKTLFDAKPQSFLLFDRNARFAASCFPSQKALNRRKGANTSPGQPLIVTKADPPFPIILFSSRSKSSAQATWTLLAPWKCILPLWYSLVHYPLTTGGNTRVGGLDELRQVAFEQGLPWFPGDYPGTEAGAEWELEQRRKRKADWERRPKAKRVAWETLDMGAGRKGEVGFGWACEFERLFGLQQPQDEAGGSDSGATIATSTVSTSITNKDKDVEMEDSGISKDQQPTGDAENNDSAAKKRTKAPHPLTQIRHLSKATFNALQSALYKTSTNTSEARPPPNAVVTVKITFPGRGVVEPCARIYRLPRSQIPSSSSQLEQSTRLVKEPTSTAVNVPPPTTQQPEVTAVIPNSRAHGLPTDLREQWLARLPSSRKNNISCSTSTSTSKIIQQPMRFPPNADQQTQKQLLLRSLVTNKAPFPPSQPEKHVATNTAAATTTTLPASDHSIFNNSTCTSNADHPLIPDEHDLIGYVTKGEFSLAQGKGVAIASISVERALEALLWDHRKKNGGGGIEEGRICVVRNAGETVGWVGRWEVI
ncbi:ribonucleases P/MRP protein subunit POP1-domain-containing protein [Coniella lustricola]|uniref:Ribonucleases P/MRP protein subunit POP1-domain-containing protein n=1 Tax=Coniella lustricola TaxID=2025994 RepID=A0A2T3A9K9_9PEZI|nr:ribonucleases P/MRP protein subunit POP1-domain-containing protein [Coniella lustricola]